MKKAITPLRLLDFYHVTFSLVVLSFSSLFFATSCSTEEDFRFILGVQLDKKLHKASFLTPCNSRL